MTNAGAVLAEQAARLAARADQIALCLDFDGTLSPIVPDPEAARPLEGMVELLRRLAGRFTAVALISGRPADYLAEHAAAPGRPQRQGRCRPQAGGRVRRSLGGGGRRRPGGGGTTRAAGVPGAARRPTGLIVKW